MNKKKKFSEAVRNNNDSHEIYTQNKLRNAAEVKIETKYWHRGTTEKLWQPSVHARLLYTMHWNTQSPHCTVLYLINTAKVTRQQASHCKLLLPFINSEK